MENVHTSSVKAAVGLPPRVTLQSRSKVHKYDSLDSAQEQERMMEINPQKSLPVVWVSKSPHRDGKNVQFVNGDTKPAPKAGTGTESDSVFLFHFFSTRRCLCRSSKMVFVARGTVCFNRGVMERHQGGIKQHTRRIAATVFCCCLDLRVESVL